MVLRRRPADGADDSRATVPLGWLAAGEADSFSQLLDSVSLITFPLPFNATGQPAICLPLGMSADGLSIGAQLVAPYGREDVLVRAASKLEAAAPWSDRHPPVSAA